MKKNILVAINVLFLVVLIALLIWPKFITNDYCDFQIDKLDISTHSINGDQCTLFYSYVSTSHTTVYVQVFKNGKPFVQSGGYCEIFPYWPRGESAGGVKSYQSSVEKTEAILNVKVGEQHRVTFDEPLVLYEFSDEAGDRYMAMVEVYRGDQIALLHSISGGTSSSASSTSTIGVGP